MTRFKRIRLLWPDHLGLARGKILPMRTKPDGTGHCISLFALGFDGNMTPHDGAYYDRGTPDLEAKFRLEDVRPSWDEGVGYVIPDVYKDDEAVMMAPRHVLRKTIEDWKALGYTPKVGIELEAYLMKEKPGGGFEPIHTPGAYVYGTGRANDPDGVIDELWDVCERIGIRLESVHSEYDKGQFELTLQYDDVMAACDDAFVFKVMAREVAQRRGYLLTFLGKPITERGGNGTHINVSLEKNGKNLMHDPGAEDGLSKIARHAIGGLLEHHQGIAAVCAPTVNAYKRLRPGQMVGVWANWGYDHRGVAVRIPAARGAATRLEHRLSDGAVGAHIATAAVLQAARLGVVSATEPPPPETGDCWEKVDTDRRVAASLSEALDDLERDEAIVEALGKEFIDCFLTVKRAEWERYLAHTTDWELDEYLHFL